MIQKIRILKRQLTVWGMVMFLPLLLQAQKKAAVLTNNKSLSIPMTAEYWNFQQGKVEFIQHRNVPVIKIERDGGLVTLKNRSFSNGTIEFDVAPADAKAAPFLSIYFRVTDKNESECFYMRVGREKNHQRNDAVQYAPFLKGVNIWDMLPQYQGPANIHNEDWNHVKLIVSGLQMRAYVNDMSHPVLQIPFLEGNSKQGTIAFEGYGMFANVIIRPDAIEGLPADRGVDLTDHDANYIRHWSVNTPIPLEPGRELYNANFPDASTTWESIDAERNGLVNLTRKFGVGSRQYVWLKARIRSAENRPQKIRLGFSDEVWVFLNQQMVYVDKNLYLQGMRKNPDGRCSIENASFMLSLQPGENELLVGVANNFYGWGIIARLENMEGIEILSGNN